MGKMQNQVSDYIKKIKDLLMASKNYSNMNEGGKPGAVIYIPSGDYHLRTQVVIDISYLKIMGLGHGFVSSSRGTASGMPHLRH